MARLRLPSAAVAAEPDLVVVEGLDSATTTAPAAVLGGMEKILSCGSRVGVLVNSVFSKPGTYVKLRISMAVIELRLRAGRTEIFSLEGMARSPGGRQC